MKWLSCVRGAVGMALTWAVGWAVTGLLIGVSSILLPGLPWERFFEFFDAPLPALALPGFLGGALFSAVLALAERRCGFSELSFARFGAWGAASGLLLSLVPAGLAAAGLATFNNPGLGPRQVTAIIIGPLTLMGAVSALASLMLARIARPWRTVLAQLLASE